VTFAASMPTHFLIVQPPLPTPERTPRLAGIALKAIEGIA
jgi:hypothetical protein